MSIIIAIAVKNLKKIWRSFKSYMIVFVLPIAFMAIFSVVFKDRPTDAQFKLGIVKSSDPVFEAYLNGLGELKNGKGEVRFIQTEFTSHESLVRAVEERKIAAGIYYENKVIQTIADPGAITGSSVTGIVRNYTDNFFHTTPTNINLIPITISNEQNTSVFQYLVPGLIVYGLLSLLPQITLTLSEEARKQKTFRYFTAKASGLQIILGYLLSQTVIGVIETVLLLATAMSLGYSVHIQALFGAFVIAILTNFFVIGGGLLLGSLFKTADTAANMGSMLSVILGFLSGAFVQFPEIKVFGGPAITALVPSFHASEALRKVLQFGRPLSDVGFELSVITVSAVVLLLIGGYLYDRTQLRNLS
jgi:ABC-type multidrug transport system permease subunit